jgi:signal transduction histidine kinase
MKKKIIFGLSLFAMMFFFGGVYIVTTMESSTYELHRLTELNHVAALRKDLLISIERVQSDVRLKGTRYATGVQPLIDGSRMIEASKRCLGCHHSVGAGRTISDLVNNIERYGETAGHTFTAFPESAIPQSQADSTLRLGDDLIRKIELIINVTNATLGKREREILKEVNQRKGILFLMVTVGPFFAVGLAFILISGITRPVNSLLDATRRLNAGDLDYRIHGLKDEFGQVADSFNEMAASLKKQMQAMQRTEQLRTCGEMAASLAHEIRNPLAGIKVSIEVLLAELDIDERDKDVLSKIIEQIRHIELLMKNLLNFARPVAAQLSMVNVNNILEKTVYFIEKHPSFSSGDSRKQISEELDDSLPDTIGDPQQLQQVFLNLFLNAADAIPSGGTITVKTRYDKADETITIEFEDTGKGIPVELMKKIFQPFFTTKGKGTGLGLAVSKRIIEGNGGSIIAMNNPSGGATFRVVLPVKEGEKGVPL